VLTALTRAVSPAIGRCELTHLRRTAIDVGVARVEHAAYQRALADLGCTVQQLPSESETPDSVFIEDIAVVLDEVTVIARPGAEPRRREVGPVEEALKQYRPTVRIEAPGTLDGGDVLVGGRQIFVGSSSRTNGEGIRQLRACAAPYGYAVHAIEVRGCLHLKSAVTIVDNALLLVNPAWAPTEAFGAFARVDVHPDEPYGANALRVGSTLIYPQAFVRTRERLEGRGLRVRTVDVSELAKAEGAVTCCSIIFET
jgi:dimethylargininase